MTSNRNNQVTIHYLNFPCTHGDASDFTGDSSCGKMCLWRGIHSRFK